MPILFAPTAPVGNITKIVPIEQGGTGATTSEGVITNLKAIPVNKINQPNGPIGLDSNGKITLDPSLINLGSGPTVNGPLSVEVNSTNNYTITNFHAATSYEVTVINLGSVTVNKDIITFTAPPIVGTSGFKVNGKPYYITISKNLPVKPTITSPVNGATNISDTVIVTTNPFAMIGQTDTHAASHWQISTSSSFATLTYESLDDTINKTRWTSGVLTASTKYYIRVRHKGSTFGYGSWSDTISVTTRSTFVPNNEQAKLLASNIQNGDRFGTSIATSTDGNTLIVTSPTATISGLPNAGCAYVFIRNGTSWTQQAILTAGDPSEADRFGSDCTISSDGNTAFFSSPICNKNTVTDSGAVYVFTRSGTTWSQQTKLTSGDASLYDLFGNSIACSTDGNTLVVGSRGKSSRAGSVYVFTRSGTTWTQQAKISEGISLSENNFGFSVDVSSDGNTAAISALGHQDYTGIVYIFTRSGTTWSQQASVQANDLSLGNFFGISICLSSDGNTLLIGSHAQPVSGVTSSGAAYVFTRSGTTWSQQAKLLPSKNTINANFGYSVSLSSTGSIAVISSYGINSAKGEVYIFTKPVSTWILQETLSATDGVNSDAFGWEAIVSSDGKTIISGAPFKNSYSGSVYIYS